MHEKRSSHEKRPSHEEPAGLQTPPEVKIRIQSSGTDIIRLASMGGTADLGQFKMDREYWRQGTFTSNTFNGDLTLASSRFANENEATLRDNFFTAGMPTNALDVPRTGAAWNQSERAVLCGRNAFLFQMAHPDGGTNHPVGVLFEIDQRENKLLGVVFYVAAASTSPPSGPIWNALDITSSALSKKSSIRTAELTAPPSGKIWWHTVMG